NIASGGVAARRGAAWAPALACQARRLGAIVRAAMAKFSWIVPVSLAWVMGCGPSYDEHTIKTPAERVREQEELAYRAEQRARTEPEVEESFEEAEKPGSFDDKQADMELKSHTISAET